MLESSSLDDAFWDCWHPPSSGTIPRGMARAMLAMKVGHRETSDCRQHFPVERFVDVLADVLLDRSDAFAIMVRTL